MSNNSNSNSSFSHAFLPGLILGLIVGSVAGAFLPDFLGGNKLPEHRVVGDGTSQARDRDQEMSYDEETQKIIDDAMNDDAATGAVDDAVEEVEGQVEDIDLPTIPAGDD